MPAISIIIPTYNRGKFIADAIRSVFAQTFEDYELLVVDDGSFDNTQEIVSEIEHECPGKLRYIYQKNQGKSAARNVGIRESRGEFIAFLDSDDLWVKDKLYVQLDYQSKYHFDLVYSRMIVQDFSGRILGYKPSRRQEDTFEWFMRYVGHVPTSTVLVRKQCFEKAGNFDESLIALEDYDLWLRISKHFKIGFINMAHAIYRRHTDNITNNPDVLYKANIVLSERYLKERCLSKDFSEVLRERRDENRYVLGRYYFDQGFYSLALRYIVEAIRGNVLLGSLFFKRCDSFIVKFYKFLKPYGLFLICLVSLLKSVSCEPSNVTVKNK